jgi:crotonobetainyl-CoA:carnitine CoA-transferase CaiB-like acyl-CoA transferase
LRQHRRLFLNKSVLNQNKDIMFADLRKPNDSMITLKQVGKCPGVIERFSGKI